MAATAYNHDQAVILLLGNNVRSRGPQMKVHLIDKDDECSFIFGGHYKYFSSIFSTFCFPKYNSYTHLFAYLVGWVCSEQCCLSFDVGLLIRCSSPIVIYRDSNCVKYNAIVAR